MINLSRFDRDSRSMSFGAHQLVSELADPLADPLFESSTRGSPGHGRSPVDEGRIASLETTMGIWSGTILDLSGKVDRILDLSDRFDRMEKMLEELVRSEKSNENDSQIPPPIAISPAPCPSPPNQMSNPPLTVTASHPWNVSPSVLSPVVSVIDQTPVMHQTMSVPEQTPEERIRLLRAIAQKYKGDSISTEEQLQMLNAIYQKYKARRDSQPFEEQHPDGVSLLQPDIESPGVSTTAGHKCKENKLFILISDPEEHDTTEAEDDTLMGSIAIASSDKSISGEGKFELTELMVSATSYDEKDNFYVQKVDLSHASLLGGQLLDDECPEDSIKGLIPSVCSLVPVKALVDEGISFQVLVWDPGIQMRLSSTLRQGRFEGEGIDKSLFYQPLHFTAIFP